jgi:hypothetical protein
MDPMRLRLSLLAILLAGAGCGTLQRHPVPVDRLHDATIPGMPGVRAFAGQADPTFQADLLRSIEQEPPGLFPRGADGIPHPDSLAISGGGAYGAFTAGFLRGWTERGTRPTFKLVTGVSTGALIAPFAFVGPAYDQMLEDAYTGLSDQDIFTQHGALAALAGESFADTEPLARLIESQVDATLLDRVAEAHAQGRRLYVGTTHLDADRFMVWNMGAIASSRDPGALALFRRVLLASASIPVMFPPVYIEVELDAEQYDEMHVDGGTKAQVFFYAAVLDVEGARQHLRQPGRTGGTLYVLRNGKLGPEPRTVDRKLSAIASRTVSSMIKASALGDLYRIWAFSGRDRIGFRYAGIPADFEWASQQQFDPASMRRLYDVGYELGRSGDPWHQEPPGLQVR